MNSTEWKEKLLKGSSGSDAWDILKDLELKENCLRETQEELEKIKVAGKEYVTEVEWFIDALRPKTRGKMKNETKRTIAKCVIAFYAFLLILTFFMAWGWNALLFLAVLAVIIAFIYALAWACSLLF